MISNTEENYLKAIYKLSEGSDALAQTNAIAAAMRTSAASVTDMIQRLHTKGLVTYQKYQGVALSKKGKAYAIMVLRKHLLWEVFLVDKLKFGWNEVHEIAEQLEHIQSPLLIQRLDDFLGNPTYGPHGGTIPNAAGDLISKPRKLLTEMAAGSSCIVSAIKEDIGPLLQYLSKRNIYLGVKISVIEKIDFDESIDISVDNQPKFNVSRKVSDHILVVT